MRRGLGGMAVLAGALTACFHPTYDAPQCSAQGECPSGFTCGADNVCRRPAPIAAALPSPPPIPVDAPYIPTDSAPITGAPECLGTFIKVCVGAPPAAPSLMLPVGTTLDTDTSTLCVPYTATPNVDACVIASGGVVLPAGVLHVTGRRKLILWGIKSIEIEGTLDVASHPGSPGPASDIDACGTGTSAPSTNAQGGGGFGGSFGAVGGAGGASFAGGAGGHPGTALSTTVLRAGCSGSAGAAGATPAGAGGRGGGAVYMVASSEIFIDGVVNASGAGGEGAPAGSLGGGGGGGTGGMIVLEARNGTQLVGQCFANGGGGGGGANGLAGPPGGDASAPASPGAGGGSSAAAASGGIGGSAANPAAAGVAGGAGMGGGGGGGSVGIIKIIGPANGGTTDPQLISPLPTN